MTLEFLPQQGLGLGLMMLGAVGLLIVGVLALTQNWSGRGPH